MVLSDGIRPRVKPYPRRVEADALTLVPDVGVGFRLEDPAGQIGALLGLLDGSRTLPEAAAALGRRWPEIAVADVEAVVAALDDSQLLEDAALDVPASDRFGRYESNLAFFSAFADLRQSRHSFHDRIARARVSLLGVGGLGSTVLYNLAGIGVGTLTVVDFDRVELKNLVRQFLYSEADVGRKKVEAAMERVRALNSDVAVHALDLRLEGPDDARAAIAGADLVVSAVDQPVEVQQWVNEACVDAGVPFVGGSVLTTRGSYFSVDPGRSGCLGCLRLYERKNGHERLVGGDRSNHVIGAAATLLGGLVTLEALRYLTRFAPPVAAGTMWIADLVSGRVEPLSEWPRLPDCPVCSDKG
jgi:molybdopterin/thiamine biosynthesis adenylyltransferase